MSKSIYNTDWCQHLLKRLNQYKDVVSRMEILETMIEKSTYPSDNMVANYKEIPTQPMIGLGKVSKDEIEHNNLMFEKRLIDSALKCLEAMDRDIIYLSTIEKLNTWHIIEIHIPNNYKDSKGRPLYISNRNFTYRKSNGLKKMAKHLGYFSKIEKSYLPKFDEGNILTEEDKKIL